MLNVFVLKKWSALLLMSFIPLLSFVLTNMYFNFLTAVSVFLFITIMMMMISNKLLDNPFRSMVEGSGLLVIKLDSTGVINPFIATIRQPYVTGRTGGRTITDIFNRKAVFSLSTAGKADIIQDEENKVLNLTITEEQFNKSRFGMYHYPVLIYNDQIKSLITKDFLSSQELTVFSDHAVLYLNRKIEELSGFLRDFGRYVVESLKPSDSFMSGKWGWVILGVAILILAVLFGPAIINAVSGSAGGAISSAVSSGAEAVSNSPVAPIN